MLLSKDQFLAASVLFCISAIQAHAQLVSLAVNSVYKEVRNTSGSGTTNVPGSGTADNFVTYNPAQRTDYFAVFNMTQTLSGVGFTSVDMRVSVNALTANVSHLMIARTTDSQGMTDAGTISILYTGAPDAVVGDFKYNLSLDFEFGSWNNTTQTWTSLNLTNTITATTFDIDFNQYVRVNASDFDRYTLNGITNLAATVPVTTTNGSAVPPGTYQIADPVIPGSPGLTNSVFSEPKNAVTFRSIGSSDFNMTFGKVKGSGNSLHMVELRTPAQNVTYIDPILVPVPEPSTYGLLGAAMLSAAVLCRRRRRSSVGV
jgi:hypothetical protein